MSEKVDVPYVDLAWQHRVLRDELLHAVEQVFDHGQFVLGPEVGLFEQWFAAACGVRYAVGVANGTDALTLAMRCLGIGEGDEVVTVPNSFLATASAIALTGARPVFVDVRDDYNMDPDRLADAITSRTKAIVPVHLTGRPADMEAILDAAERHGLHVIEDAAQAVGATCHGRAVGSFGVAGAFSLHPLKNLSACGDAGVITTSDDDLYEKLILARNHGLRNRDECDTWGRNSRLDTLQAALLLVKMKHLDEWTQARRAHAELYREQLRGLVGVPEDRPHEHAVYHTFVVQTDRRDALREHLRRRGVETKVHYPIPIHLQPAARHLGYRRGDFPVAERQAGRVLSLPVGPELDERRVRHVAQCVAQFHRQSSGSSVECLQSA
jgi:dTDP-4-amino-4,6-dideoxygalactose transaminase